MTVDQLQVKIHFGLNSPTNLLSGNCMVAGLTLPPSGYWSLVNIASQYLRGHWSLFLIWFTLNRVKLASA